MQNTDSGIEGIFRRHVRTVYRLCYSYFRNAADAEDATQQVFMKLIDHPQSFTSTEHEKAWLLRVAANHCKDVLKSAARKSAAQMPDDIVDQNNPAEGNEVLAAVLALPEKYKACVYMHYFEGYKTDEIAQMLDANPSTLRNWLADARALLKNALEV